MALSESLSPYQNELIEHAMSVDALKFGQFTLKSGRISPYFFNAGLLCTGPILASLSKAYAKTIADALAASKIPSFDVLFGPAYKGIPFASTTALVLHTEHNIPVGFAYDRKEAKDHGEGGKMVGVDVKGKKVLVLDDVMTSGKAIRGSIETIRAHGGEVVGVIQALNREEVGQDGVSSTVKEIEGLIGEGRVLSILRMRDLMVWLEAHGETANLDKMKEYWDQYGLK
ncbi:orotate phosphoribosyltransferase [Coprinopsis cinerea okayama7|uniref:orotate phosphoribosyltransferase n=1 Tax=Coprinopsis cinerea (strain Okayama-7 / 130 / ATCC MYA-4618 / FGSC 9003) TaxID=240176 RepID=A8P5G1_COPC7|nr:orotate phosphoribosyltransferase [Coprinopsis cinerea okayama7\|eukprot:XP_001838935.2 orotate phosphoribosyltransferase [Coprinopsis cinerea okayama7\